MINGRIKIATAKLPMISPGLRDNDILPSGGASNSGITLDYSAITMGGSDNGVAINHTDDKKVFYHGSPNKFDTLNAGSWVTPYKEDAFIFGVPWDSNDLSNTGDESGRPPKKLEFKPGKTPEDGAVFIYEVTGNVEPASTNTGVNYDWNYRTTEDMPAKLIKTYTSWKKELLSKENATDDPYNDNNKGTGSFVGSHEAGFELRHNLDYGSTVANLTALVIKGNAKFIENNTVAEQFYADIESYLNKKGYNVHFDVSVDADLLIGHSNGLTKLNHHHGNSKLLAFGAIPEKATRSDIIFANHPIDENYLKACHYTRRYDYPIPEHYVFTDEMKLAIDSATSLIKKSYPDYPQYSDPEMYTQVSERNPATPAFNLFNTYYADDVEVTEDEEDVVEVEDDEPVKKNAFVKTALSYDSNQIIQELIKIPEVKSLIEQQASGFVDKIIVTTPGADIQQTQQNLSQPQSSGLPPITLQPISGNPYGHVWISEDPTTHQKKPLDRTVRIDRVTDQWGTLVTILHEIGHHRHPDWSEAQVESEAENIAGAVKQHIKTASGKTNIVFVKRNLTGLPVVECDLADTYQKQVIGLQSYSSLRPQNGLLFTYASQQPLTFWMGTVSFPIDIVFANQNNQIVKIYRNCQPNSQELYTCDGASKVIEVVSSFCAFHDIDVGDHVFYADDSNENFTKHILEQIMAAKIAQQKDLDMTDWSIKIVMKKEPDSRRFLKVSWSPEDYSIKKADILVNPNPELIREALKEMTLEKLVRHSLLHILAGAKNELPEDKEQKLITDKLY